MHAALVAAGIFLSRILGLVRESLKARFLGASGSVAADSFTQAFQIPNLLQNLFGEGALSASFIPVYANALARGDKEQADRIAGAIGVLLGLLTAILVLIGVTMAPAIVSVIAPGFKAERRELTIYLTRILFPGAALFVFSAWCLGILNSHRRFFLSYAAPVAWNLAMIAALLLYRHRAPADLAVKIAWASVVGAALQFLVQLPVVMKLTPHLRWSLGRGNPQVKLVARNFAPAFVGRGVVQINAFVDQWISSFLPIGVPALLFYSRTLTMLPISLFAIAISAAELPEMSSALGAPEEMAAKLRTRLATGLRRIAFFVIPSAIAFLAVGDVIAAALFQGGRFTARDTAFTWGILAAASVGLLATSLARLYSSAFFAMHDTRTPLRFAIVRVAIAGIAGYLLAMNLPGALGIDQKWGAAALTLASSLAGWVEFFLLRSSLGARIGATGVASRPLLGMSGAAVLAGTAAFGIKLATLGMHRFVIAALVLGTFGVLYIGLTRAFGIPEADVILHRLRRARREGTGQ
jgi:putative peptidoglycan lipid II flippase